MKISEVLAIQAKMKENSAPAKKPKPKTKPNIKKALEQAELDSKEKDMTAVAVCHFQGEAKEKSIVSMRLDVLMEIIKSVTKL